MVTKKKYDDGFAPPGWWLEEFDRVREKELDWTDRDVVRKANEIANTLGWQKKWGPDRIVKMRGGSATLKLVVAVSKATGVAPPVLIAESLADAAQLDRWRKLHPAPVEKTQSGSGVKEAEIEQALVGAVKAAKDQTRAVPSRNEGSPRGLGHRRASTRR